LKAVKLVIALANLDYIGFLEEAAEKATALKWVGTPGKLSEFPPSKNIDCLPNHPDEDCLSCNLPRAAHVRQEVWLSLSAHLCVICKELCVMVWK
jgi:hypothetical protein